MSNVSSDSHSTLYSNGRSFDAIDITSSMFSTNYPHLFCHLFCTFYANSRPLFKQIKLTINDDLINVRLLQELLKLSNKPKRKSLS